MDAANCHEIHIEELRMRNLQLKLSLTQEIARLGRIVQESRNHAGECTSLALRADHSAVNGHDDKTADAFKTLTPREFEILKAIAEGASTKQIAERLGIAFKTAACHRHHIMQKLDVHETVSLVRIAVRSGLVNI